MTRTVRTLVVAGHGMAGHRLVAELRGLDAAGAWRVVVLGEEPHPAYDRVALSSYLDGRSAADLALAGPGSHDPLLELRLNTGVAAVDRAAHTATTTAGDVVAYDALVLATGSRPFVPPVPGHDLPGCFGYRSLGDLDAIRAAAVPGRPGVVIGGGLLGLEAANALRLLGMEPHVVELAPRLMPLQVDAAGGGVLGRRVARRGLRIHCGVATAAITAGPDGRVASVVLADGSSLAADVVVFSAGVRPRDELAAWRAWPGGARRVPGRRAVPDAGRADLGDRRVRGRVGPLPRAGRTGLPDGDLRRPAAPGPGRGAVRGGGPVDQAQAARRGGGELRRRPCGRRGRGGAEPAGRGGGDVREARAGRGLPDPARRHPGR